MHNYAIVRKRYDFYLKIYINIILNMVQYNCPRCFYSTDRKSSIEKHINRLKLCKLRGEDLNPKDFRDDILKNNNKIKGRINNNKYENNDLEEENRQLRKENRELKMRGKTINNTTNNTVNINITLPFDKTNYDFLTEKDFNQCINRMIMSVPNLIKKIHFNPEHPENHNIYISNRNKNKLLQYDGKHWNVVNHKETIDKLINEHEYILEEWLESGEDKFPRAMQKFKKYVSIKKKDDEVDNKIKDEINMMLYNNRKMIKQ